MKAFIVIFSFLASTAFAHEMPAPVIAKDFEAMKTLLGTWEGKTKMEGKEATTTVNYKLTSGGTAIVETLGEGTPHEMVSVYSTRANKVAMTHYCAAGNQPEMALKKADGGKSFAFEMNGTKGIENPKDMHMHAVTLTMADKNHLKQEWTNYVGNKKSEVAVFEFTRKQ